MQSRACACAEPARESVSERALGRSHPKMKLSQERLKQQIQVLQDALRAGQRPDQPQALLMQLCTQPALLDDEAAARIERLIMRSREMEQDAA